MSQIQKQLDTSKTWKGYKELLYKIEKSESIPFLKKARATSEKLDEELENLFKVNPDLVQSLIQFKNQKISNRVKFLTPKRGRRPKVDYDQQIVDLWNGIERRFSMVKAFRELSLRDSLMDTITTGISNSISAERQKIISSRIRDDGKPEDPDSPRKTDFSSIESKLLSVESQLDQWYDQEVNAGLKPIRLKPSQSDLDKSNVWETYHLLHNKVQRAKTIEDLEKASIQPGALKDSLKIFFNDPILATDLLGWLQFETEKKRQALIKSTPKSDSEKWNEVLFGFEVIQTCFRIVSAFRAKELDEPLTRTMATPLPIRLHNLIGSALSVVERGKSKPRGNEKRITEMREFEKSLLKAYKTWKKD